MKHRKISTFKRLILIFLVIIIPIIVAGFCAIGFYGKKNEQEALNLVHMQMRYHIQKHEENMLEIRRRVLELMNNQDVKQLATLPEIYSEYEKSRAVLRVQHELDSIKNFQNYIGDICVILPGMERVIHANGYAKGSVTQLKENQLQEIKNMRPGGEIGLFNDTGILTMPVVVNTLTGEPMYAIVVRFLEEELKQELSYSVSVADSLFRFEIGEQGYVIDDLEAEPEYRPWESLTTSDSHKAYRWGHEKWYVFREDAGLMQGTYYKMIPAASIVPASQTLALLMFLFFTVTTVCICIFFGSAHRLVNAPLKDLTDAFRQVEKGNFTIRLEGREKNDFGYLYQAFNRMVENLQKSIDEIYNQKMLIQKTELKQLQAQINPHFLYNSYFLLHRLIKREDYEKAVLFSKEMGTYFRYITRNGRDVVSLEEEDGHARIYAQMQGMRFEGRIRIEYGELPACMKTLQVPRLIIQPILENAFGHGLENKEEKGLLRVTYVAEGEDRVLIRVEDNGEELTDAELLRLKEDFSRQPAEREIMEVTGMVNINRRLKIFYGKGSGLYLSRSQLGGLCAEVRIGRRTQEDGKTVSAADRG